VRVVDTLYEQLNSFLNLNAKSSEALASTKSIEPKFFAFAALMLSLGETDDLRGITKLSRVRAVFVKQACIKFRFEQGRKLICDFVAEEF
jgi:hypothetical protein